MRINKVLCAGAVAIATVSGAGTTFFESPQRARAPEPAQLVAPLTTSWPAAAYYVASRIDTKVLYFTGSWTNAPYGPAAGTPCASSALATGAVTSKVIVRSGAWARCV